MYKPFRSMRQSLLPTLRATTLFASPFLVLFSGHVEASSAEAWGFSRMLETPTSALAKVGERTAELDQVTMNAGGAFQRPPVIRQHLQKSENAQEHHHHHAHHHHHDNIKDMFDAMDTNRDGFLSNSEIKAHLDQEHRHGKSPTMRHLKEQLEATVDAEAAVGDDLEPSDGISYATFVAASEHVAAEHRKRHQATEHRKRQHNPKNRHHHAIIRAEHSQDDDDDSWMEVDERLSTRTEVTTGSTGSYLSSVWKTCGGHKAPTCEKCPVTDASGLTVFNHGAEWCHGDCEYQNEKCQDRVSSSVASPVSAPKERTVTSNAVPDVLDPEMTEADTKVVNEAAEDAVKEEKMEKLEKEDHKDKKASPWLYVIIVFAVILGFCAIASSVAVVVFCLMAPAAGSDALAKEEALEDDNDAAPDGGNEGGNDDDF